MVRQGAEVMAEALKALDPATVPAKWATAQSNLTAVNVDLAAMIYSTSDTAEMSAYAAGITNATNFPEVVKARTDANAVLDGALADLQAALDTRGAALNPLDRAMLTHTLASGYEQRGEMNHAPADLKTAVGLFQSALTVHTKDRVPAQWVRTSNNLAVTLKKLSDETNDPAPLRQAIGIYKDVVATISRDMQPLDWADYQVNLGNAMTGLASFEDPVANLDAALAAYAAAGQVITVEQSASKWKGLQPGIGTTLLMKSLKAFDRPSALESQKVLALLPI